MNECYQKTIEIYSDILCRSLLRIRKLYGDRWTENMVRYTISKRAKIGHITYRSPCPYQDRHKIKYISFDE